MRDLYKRLDVPRDASAGAIRERLEKLDPELRGDVESILLHPARRDLYDQQLALMHRLRKLRQDLGVAPSSFWSRRCYPDFVEVERSPRRWALLVFSVVVAVVLLGIAVFFLL